MKERNITEWKKGRINGKKENLKATCNMRMERSEGMNERERNERKVKGLNESK